MLTGGRGALQSLRRDWRTLRTLVRPLSPAATHGERLEHFYRDQAEHYDDFRERLLPGRRALIDDLPLAPGAVWVDFGGGTARNLLFAGDRLKGLGQVIVIDLTPSLLAVAHRRRSAHDWGNVTLMRADATATPLPDQVADIVTFSYSLTMIAGWQSALAEATRVLRPGGCVGVVDFYVSARHAAPFTQHGPLTRRFWPRWFRQRNVHLTSEHLAALRNAFDTVAVDEARTRVPYLPFGRVPVYRFLGTRPGRVPV